MGLYIRKGINIGPVRLNFSKSGVGASFGVKGARVGVDARGKPYVHVGRYGLYYREQLHVGKSIKISAAGWLLILTFGIALFVLLTVLTT